MSRVRVLVGTKKGAFILTSDGKREKWDISGPHFAGWEMYHLKGSPADPNRIYASQSSGWFGQIIQRSDDGGKTGSSQARRRESPRRLRWNSERRKQQVCVRRLRGNRQTSYDASVVRRDAASVGIQACVAPGAVVERSGYRVCRSGRRGAVPFERRRADWKELSGLRGHGTGPKWQPGAGGMCLHTIILDPGDAGANLHRHLGRGSISQRRRRKDVEADQSGTALAVHS